MDAESSIGVQEQTGNIEGVPYQLLPTWDLIRHLSMYRMDMARWKRWSYQEKVGFADLLLVVENRLGESISDGTRRNIGHTSGNT